MTRAHTQRYGDKNTRVDDGGTVMSIAMLHIASPPAPLRSHVPELPPVLDALILRALSKDPAARPAAAEFEQALIAIAFG